MYDLIVIGGGPAGAAAAIFSARKNLKTLIVTGDFGGQSIVSSDIENWIGVKKISGFDLAKMLEDHVRAQEGLEIKMPEKVISVKEVAGGWEIETDKSGVYQTKAVIVTSGGRRRHLGVPGEEKFEGKGVFHCTTCDAPIFKNKQVAVVGAGEAGLSSVIDLMSYASKIYLIANKELSINDNSTQEILKNSDKVVVIENADVQEILGDKFVSGLKYFDKNDNQIKELALEGVFVEIGLIPNSEFVKDLVDLNQIGEIIADCKTGMTSRSGIYAAGFVTDRIYKQNNISAGDAAVAVLSAYDYLLKIKKQ